MDLKNKCQTKWNAGVPNVNFRKADHNVPKSTLKKIQPEKSEVDFWCRKYDAIMQNTNYPYKHILLFCHK